MKQCQHSDVHASSGYLPVGVQGYNKAVHNDINMRWVFVLLSVLALPVFFPVALLFGILPNKCHTACRHADSIRVGFLLVSKEFLTCTSVPLTTFSSEPCALLIWGKHLFFFLVGGGGSTGSFPLVSEVGD